MTTAYSKHMWNLHPSFTQGDTPELPGPCAFYMSWIASGCGTFCKIYNCLLLPVYYIYGIFCVVLKVLLLNQPGLDQCRSIVRFETDLPLPGLDAKERLEFAKVIDSGACANASWPAAFNQLQFAADIPLGVPTA